MKIVIIIPTYNEKENIGRLIMALQEEFANLPYDMHILVVDDNSPDGTGDVVRTSMEAYDNIYLLSGEKQGLGAAYIRGMQYALNKLQAEVVVEMDADFSHKPTDLPRLLAALEGGGDFVIGSRYVPGGKIPENWGPWRRALSKWGNIFARYVAGMYPVRDCTAGFRAIRGSLLRCIDFSKLGVQGYAFQIALLNQALVLGATVREVPVEFIDRERGATKLGLKDIIEFFINVWWIRLQASRTFLKFALVGLSGVLVNLFCFIFLLNLGVNKYGASPLAIELSILNNFLLNNYWTFKFRNFSENLWLRGLKFKIISLIALSISYTTFILLNLVYPKSQPAMLQAIAIVPATLVNYFLNSYWTFKKPAGVLRQENQQLKKSQLQVNGHRLPHATHPGAIGNPNQDKAINQNFGVER